MCTFVSVHDAIVSLQGYEWTPPGSQAGNLQPAGTWNSVGTHTYQRV